MLRQMPQMLDAALMRCGSHFKRVGFQRSHLGIHVLADIDKEIGSEREEPRTTPLGTLHHLESEDYPDRTTWRGPAGRHDRLMNKSVSIFRSPQ